MRKIQRMIDSNEDGFISLEEEKRALDVLEKAKAQRLKEVQGSFRSAPDRGEAGLCRVLLLGSHECRLC